MMVKQAPYGSWTSPISSDIVAGGSITFYEMHAADDALYWLELHPREKGRLALIRYDGKERPLLPQVSVRSRVHEYGGGALFVDKSTLIYSNDADRQLYDLSAGALTCADKWRFADGCGPIWVGEEHNGRVENCLVSIKGGSGLEVVASGHDFYSSPRLSPDQKQLAYITWDFPDMQWDSSTLWLADWTEDRRIHNARPIDGGSGVSVCNVRWSSAGVLHYVCDRSGWGNIYCFDGKQGVNLCEIEAECAPAPWVFGMPSYACLGDGSIVCACTQRGIDRLCRLHPRSGHIEDLGLPYTSVTNVVAWKGGVSFFGGSPTLASSIVYYDLEKGACETIKEAFSNPLVESQISIAEPMTFETAQGSTGHAFYYPPNNPDCAPPKGELPPLLVKVHGGPTARSTNPLSLSVQYWTSRGFAFCDVNYGGSTGYGRAYRERLAGNWGVVDVDDATHAAQALVKRGLCDPKRLLIFGGSAGGYTALAALALRETFAGGTSLYGVCDLEMLSKDTHKFESRYNDRLVAPYPEGIELIRARSPMTHIDRMSRPILLLQGLEDAIVPPSQSIAIFEALKKKEIPTGILLFEGEGHGFRGAAAIKRALDAQLYFYAELLGIHLPEPFIEPPVHIVRSGAGGQPF